jgi:hypothetical protein
MHTSPISVTQLHTGLASKNWTPDIVFQGSKLIWRYNVTTKIGNHHLITTIVKDGPLDCAISGSSGGSMMEGFDADIHLFGWYHEIVKAVHDTGGSFTIVQDLELIRVKDQLVG